MVKIKHKRKRETRKALESYIKKGYSANKIQKLLQKRKLGIRRKVLLSEIRSIKKIQIKPEKRIKHIPKKYKKKIFAPPVRELVELYRVSYIIPSIPVHSRPFKRVYLGFRLNVFSDNKKRLLNEHERLRNLLIELTSQYLGANVKEWNNWTVSIGREYPNIVFVSRKINNTWIFAVEKEGSEQYSRSGVL